MTSKYVKLILTDIKALEVFKKAFFKESWETDKGIKDADSPSIYIARDTDATDEAWEETESGRAKNGVYKVVAGYKVVAWFENLDDEKVAATLISQLQLHRAVVKAITFNSRQIYQVETEDELRSSLRIIRIDFDIEAVVTIRECIQKTLCKEDICS